MTILLRAAIAGAALFAATNAHADTKLIPIVFERVAAHRAGDDLVIDYRMAATSWRTMESDRIGPKLHVSLVNADRGRPNRVDFDRDLAKKEGTVTISVPSSLGALRCDIWVTGGHRGTQIAWM